MVGWDSSTDTFKGEHIDSVVSILLTCRNNGVVGYTLIVWIFNEVESGSRSSIDSQNISSSPFVILSFYCMGLVFFIGAKCDILLSSALLVWSPKVKVERWDLSFTGGTERNYCSCGDFIVFNRLFIYVIYRRRVANSSGLFKSIFPFSAKC